MTYGTAYQPLLATVAAGRRPGQVAGKTPHLLAVQFDAPTSRIGQIVPVRIVEAGTNSLFGAAIEAAAAA